MKEYTVLSPIGIRTDFDNFNTIQNRYWVKSYTPKRSPPKKLIKSVIREFRGFCKTHHIDIDKYLFIEPCEYEGDWIQFDFLDSDGENPARIMVSNVIADKNGKIFQRVIGI